MLLDFSVENYKSFLKKAQFSMTPAPKQHGLDYSILTEKIGKKALKVYAHLLFMDPMHLENEYYWSNGCIKSYCT